MQKIILKIGKVGSTILITLIATMLSLLITIFIMETFGTGVNLVNISTAFVAPIIISPLVSWSLVGLVIKIHYLEKEQRKLATFDALTGVMARRAFLTNLHTLFAVAERNKQPLSLATIDLDDFKKINDQYGHGGGDAVLQAFSSMLNEHLRESDLTGRIGGEEFAIALLGLNADNCIDVLEKIRSFSANTPVSYLDNNIRYTISIGLTTYNPADPADQQEVLRQSDVALYKAKNLGKNRVVVYGNGNVGPSNT